MIHSRILESLSCDISGKSPSLNDDLGVNSLMNELLALSQKLSGKDSDGSSSITDLLILSASKLDHGFCCGVSNINLRKNVISVSFFQNFQDLEGRLAGAVPQ